MSCSLKGGAALSPATAVTLPTVKGGYEPAPDSFVKGAAPFGGSGRKIFRKTTVRKSRIKDQGALGKSKGIQINHPGALSGVGYSAVDKPSVRHATLRRAIKKFGPTSTFRKLRAVSTFTKRTSKGRSRKFLADSNWVKKKYM